MKTKELLESVGIKFNSNGFCVVTQTDVNRALKAYSAQQIKEIERLKDELNDKTLEVQVANTSIDLLSSQLDDANERIKDLGNSM